MSQDRPFDLTAHMKKYGTAFDVPIAKGIHTTPEGTIVEGSLMSNGSFIADFVGQFYELTDEEIREIHIQQREKAFVEMQRVTNELNHQINTLASTAEKNCEPYPTVFMVTESDDPVVECGLRCLNDAYVIARYCLTYLRDESSDYMSDEEVVTMVRSMLAEIKRPPPLEDAPQRLSDIFRICLGQREC